MSSHGSFTTADGFAQRGMRGRTRVQRRWDGFLVRLEFAMAIGVVFFSPMNFLRLQFFYFTLSDALACVSLAVLLFQKRLTLHPIGPVGSFYWFGGLALLLAGLLFSSMIYGDPLRGIVFTVQYFFAYLVLLVVISGRSHGALLILAQVFVASIVLMSLHGIYLINIVGERGTGFVSGSGRLTGFVERENECAALIAMTVPVLLYVSSRGGWRRLYLLALPIMAYAVMLTGSNTGLGAFALAIGLYVVLTLRWRQLALVAVSGLVVIVAIDHWARAYLPDIFQRRVLGALESGDIAQAGSFDHRLELIHEAIAAANHTVLFGMGADQYALTSFLLQPVHNLYLLLWTEGGPLCMIGFIVMIAAGYVPAFAAFRTPGGRGVGACAFTGVSLFLICVNAFPSVYGRFWVTPIFLGIAMAHAFQASARRDPHASIFTGKIRRL